MWTQHPVQGVDPLCLPVGLRIGAWRVVGFGGRGAYGSLYRVVQEGHEADGSRALKLAHQPGDERFQREAWLLSRIHSPYVPELYAQGVWEHSSGRYPYLVMEWIDGEPLYDWAARRNPTQRQALGWVLHVARALEATHAAGGVHRDVKGGNVLVRRGDGRAYLTDFGAGHYRGAGTLTSKLLPPGTPAYRSPEAWAFLNAFLRHPTVHYPASACDDLFALGLMAYRLVTDGYPPSPQPGEPGSEVWSPGGSGPRRPSELNPRVSPSLDALILRLLAVAPVERFHGRAQEAVKALEQAVRSGERGLDAPLFHSGYDHRPCWRSPEAVRIFEERDAAAREQHARKPEKSQPAPRARVRVWGVEAVVAAVGLLLAGVLGVGLHEGQGGVRTVVAGKADDRSTDAVGDSAASAPSRVVAAGATKASKSVAGKQLPEQPLPGQRKPPCDRGSEVELRGGCWYKLDWPQPPCKADAYEWKGACYVPSYSAQREPTAAPP